MAASTLSFVFLGIYRNNHHHMLHAAALPTALYGVVLLLAAAAYTILQRTIIRPQGPGSRLAAAVGRDMKGKISPLFYAVAIPAAFLNQWISDALFVIVGLMWLDPDPRIEKKLIDRS